MQPAGKTDPGFILNHIRRDVAGLPPLPETAFRVLALTRDPDTSAKELVDAINHDQALVANVLRLCNSAHYGLPRSISSVHQGLMYLGFCTVRTLVLTSGLKRYLFESLPAYGYEHGGLWRHSIAVALVARRLWLRFERDNDDVAYTAGLLHDIGKTVLAKFLAPQLDEVLGCMRRDGLTFCAAESRVLGIDHAALGADIAAMWNFPHLLVESICHHHAPDKAGAGAMLARTVHVANSVAARLGYGFGREAANQPAMPEVLESFHLTDEAYERFCQEAQEDLEQADEWFE